MSPLGFAWRSLSREPARAGLGIAGVAIVGALLFDMLLLSNGLLLSFADLLESTGWDVRVTATDALPGTGPALDAPEALAAELRRLPEVDDVLAVRFGSAVVTKGEREMRVSVIATGPEPKLEGRLLRGRSVQRAMEVPEIVVNENLARDAGVAPGSVLEMRPRGDGASDAVPARRFAVVGVALFPFDQAGERTAAVSLDGFARGLLGPERDEADLLLVASDAAAGPAAAVAAIRAARPGLHPFTIEDLLQKFSRGDFSYFRQISGVLTAITSFFTFLLVATLLTVSVNQRLGEVAALRALGFTRRRVAADLLWECALIVGAGSLLAVPIGLGLARVLDGILGQMPGVPERMHFFVVEPRAVALHLVLLAGAGVLAAAYPVLIAVRLPIAATLRREVIS